MINAKFKILKRGRGRPLRGLLILPFAFYLLHSAAAADLTLAWDASATPGCTYLLYAHTNAVGITNLTATGTAVRVNAGTNLSAQVEGLTGPARWYFVATANLGGIQSDPSNMLIVDVPAAAKNMRTIAVQYSVTVTNFSDVGFFRLRIPAPAP